MNYEPITDAAEFRGRITLGHTTESLTLDFKHDLDRLRAASDTERRKGQLELCRDVAQFANAWGGTLLLGVDEKLVDGVKVADKINGLIDFDAHREWIEQAIRNYLVPATITKRIFQVRIGADLVIPINVPPSQHLVSVWDRAIGTIECVYRTNHGKEHMNPDEVERHIMNRGRAAKLALVRAKEAVTPSTDVDLSSGIWIRVHRTSTSPPALQRIPAEVVRLCSIDDFDLELSFWNVKARLPYGLLREAWATGDGRIGIFLHVRVVKQGDTTFTLEPF